MTSSLPYMSFLIRLWQEHDPGRTPLLDWQAEVEHIQSGERQAFATLESSLDFIRRRAQQDRGGERGPVRGQTMHRQETPHGPRPDGQVAESKL